MKGLEYVVREETHGGRLFIIVKQLRHDPDRWETKALYYVLDGVVYQCPPVNAVIRARLVRVPHRSLSRCRHRHAAWLLAWLAQGRCATLMSEALDKLFACQWFDVHRGHQYYPSGWDQARIDAEEGARRPRPRPIAPAAQCTVDRGGNACIRSRRGRRARAGPGRCSGDAGSPGAHEGAAAGARGGGAPRRRRCSAPLRATDACSVGSIEAVESRRWRP